MRVLTEDVDFDIISLQQLRHYIGITAYYGMMQCGKATRIAVVDIERRIVTKYPSCISRTAMLDLEDQRMLRTATASLLFKDVIEEETILEWLSLLQVLVQIDDASSVVLANSKGFTRGTEYIHK